MLFGIRIAYRFNKQCGETHASLFIHSVYQFDYICLIYIEYARILPLSSMEQFLQFYYCIVWCNPRLPLIHTDIFIFDGSMTFQFRHTKICKVDDHDTAFIPCSSVKYPLSIAYIQQYSVAKPTLTKSLIYQQIVVIVIYPIFHNRCIPEPRICQYSL